MKSREFSGKMALAAIKYGKEKDYWLNKLSGEIVKTRFPYDLSKTGYQLEVTHTRLTGDLFARLMKISKTSDYTLHMILAAGLAALLGKYTSNQDIIVGIPIYSQDDEKEFLNTALALRNQLKDNMNFRELLFQVRQTIIEANEHRNYPLEILLSHLNMTFPGNDFPLFDVVVLLENIHQKAYIEHTRPNVIFSFLKTHDRIEGKVEYNAFRYHQETIERILEHYKRLMAEAVFNAAMPVLEIDLLAEEEKRQLLYDFNRTKTQYPGDKTIEELFREQAVKTPCKVAVIDEEKTLTYKALNEWSHRLAVYLQNKGLRNEDAVGIMAENNINMIVGILGILKAGGAYLPLNSQYPGERQKLLLQDGNARKLLITTDEDQASECNDIDNLEVIHLGQPAVYPKQGRLKRNHSYNNLAYIMYTSGSSGDPKGTMVEHRGVVRLVKNTNYVEFKPGDRILQTGALDFDASTFEIWGALLNGLQLYLARKEAILIPGKLKSIIQKNEITTIWMTSSLFNQMLDEDIEIFTGLKNLLVGGEVLSPTHINRVREAFPKLKVINGYGPTENTTFSVTHWIRQNYKESIPIGKPISNSTAYIIDKQYCLVPLGVPGELCVGGDGLSRGYLNNPQLTAEKFDHKRKKVPGKKNYMSPRSYMSYIYKTGDLARWLPDGNIDFLGRIDYQVKIRGYRIEPGEIESHLTKLEEIDEAVAAVRKNGPEKYLCAYIVLKSSKVLDVVELKNKLSENLPDYMIPSYFVQIEKIPLTSNGKVDRKALPEPDVKAGENYVPPRDKTEKELVEIWSRVLGAEKDIIGIDSNFFDLGGHSLKATLLTARLHKEMNVKIHLAELFRTPTIREIAGYIKGLAKEKFLSIEAAEKKEYYKLSSAQKRLYVLQQMELKAINYNIPQVAVLKGDLAREKFEETFRKLIKRHESLRTSFHMIADQPFQRVHDQVEFKIEYVEPGKEAGRQRGKEGTRGLAPLPRPITGKSQPAANLIKNFVRPFDLSQAPLVRVGLIKEQDKTHILMIDIHHIITDGTSIGILIKEFMKLYAGEELPGTRIQYKDFSKWENKRSKSEEKKKQEEYWKKQFAGDIPVMDLPTDYPRPGIKTFTGSSLSFEINTEETRAIKSLVSEQGITLFIALAALFDIFISKISSQEEVIIGIPTAGRRHADLAQIIGMFVNTLVLRNHPAGHKTIKEFLNEVKENALAAFENQEYQFEELVEKLALNRDISRNPLFEVMFSLHNQTDPEQIREIKVPDLNLKPYQYEERTAKFDLELIVVESNQRLSLTFIYGSKLFKKETVERFVNYFKRIVNFVVENSETKIYEIDLLPGEEKKKILYHLNETTAPYPENKTIHELFAQQVEQTPDHIALVGKDEGWKGIRVEGEKEAGLRAESQELRAVTYKELNNNSNQLSHLLREKGIQTDTMAGIMVERSTDMIIGILGILKAGGAYLPIEPDYPEERINYMLADSGAKVLVTTSTLAKEGEKLRSLEVKKNFEVIFIDSVEFSRFSSSHLLNFSTSHSLNLAYIIYTSGSTGKPKGVMINHQNVVPLVKNPNFIDFTPGDRLLLTGNFVFDITTFEIWWPLLNGLTLFPADQPVILDPEKLENFINKHKISILHLTPQLFNQLAGQRLEIFERLKYFLVGGDLVRPQYVNLLRNTYKDIKILHMYGPTENTTFSTFHPVNQYYDTTIPIGKPISNSSVYIVDKYDKPVPIGIPGELLVGGDGVARGYLNNPELTNSKFQIPGPRITRITRNLKKEKKVPGKRIYSHMSYIYKTGDLARWLADGNIEFLGRVDFQVKIRGIRIELGEIEQRLPGHENIREAVVIARESSQGEKYLCAYIVPDHEQTFDNTHVNRLKKNLSHSLPDYMIPTYFVRLEQIPLTPNGKIDRKALPSPELKPGEEYEAPGNEIEKKLAVIWSELLGIEIDLISINANFFELGGHSLRAATLISKIRKEFNVNLPLVELFKDPTVKSLAGCIRIGVSHGTMGTLTAIDDGLVLLKPGITKTDRTPGPYHLFLIHYGTGEIDKYTEFCKHLTNDMNYWGIRADRLENGAPRNLTIEEIARNYIEKIKNLQPGGPYYLAAWCFGGLIAFEMVKQWEKQGEQIGFFGLINSPPPPPPPPPHETRIKPGEFNLESELKLIEEYSLGIEIKEKLKNVNELSQFWLLLTDYLETNNYDIEPLKKTIMEIGWHQALSNPYQLNLNETVYYLNLYRTFRKALANYTPKGIIHTPVDYFAASIPGKIIKERWNDYCSKPIRFHEVPGDHFSIFKMPQAASFAKLFENVLQNTNDNNPSALFT